jgi:hypothetical protein
MYLLLRSKVSPRENAFFQFRTTMQWGRVLLVNPFHYGYPDNGTLNNGFHSDELLLPFSLQSSFLSPFTLGI